MYSRIPERVLDLNKLCAAFFPLLIERDRNMFLQLQSYLFPDLSRKFALDLISNMIPVLVSTVIYVN